MPGDNQICAMRVATTIESLSREKQQIISHFGIKRVIVQGA